MRHSLIESHKKNTLKLIDLNEFNVNPFLLNYLGFFFGGDKKYTTLAKVLLYPRILGTSITTSFGSQMQKFISDVLNGYGSTTPGIDLEFTDKIDGRYKYAQLKSGPNAINKDDVVSISNHFKAVINRARTNNVSVMSSDLVFCLLYGEPHEKNSFIKELERDYPVYVGQEFWHRFTGDQGFYRALIRAISEVAEEINMKPLVDEVIKKLAVQIEQRYGGIL